MTIYMDRASVEAMTEKDIRDLIRDHPSDLRCKELFDYYTGKHRILRESKKDAAAPDNKLVVNMAKYITDTATSYFLGEPVIYGSEDEEFLSRVQQIFDYNDEQDHNMELGKMCSIYGQAYEMLYLDEDAEIRIARVPPGFGIMICETDSGFSDPVAFIRTMVSKDRKNNVTTKIEYWTAWQVYRFRSFNGGELVLTAVEDHYWQDVPFVEYRNNEERLGDFEGVTSLIDAYNRASSNSANFFQYNDEAILKVMKLGDVSSRDIADMKEKGAIILEDGGDIQWLLKEVNDAAMENHKTRLREDIHTMACVPHMCDENFGGDLSGVAISYKLWGMEQLCSAKERKFKKGLQRRIELIANILNLQGGRYDWRSITPKFRRNKPQNDSETADIVTKLSGELSQETRLQMIPWVEDAQEELRRIEEEKQRDAAGFSAYGNIGGESVPFGRTEAV